MRKRISLFAAAMAAVLTLIPAMSVEAVTITVDGNAKEYQAYKLLDLTTSAKEDAEGDEDAYNYSYTVNSKYESVMKDAAPGADANKDGTVSDKELIDYIGQLDADGIRVFADDVWKGISSNSLAADFTSTDGNIISVDSQGYYLITESKSADDPDSVSLVMLDTAGQENITVTSKEGIPTLEKKVEGEIDGAYHWMDATDANEENNLVQFRLTGTLPATIGNYKTYKYIFHDTMSAGLTFESGSVFVTIDKNTVDTSKYTVVTDSEDGCTLEIKFDDLIAVAKEMGIDLTKDTEIVAQYNARINKNAVIGNEGNPNEAYLEFSNNPYVEDDTSNTPDDTVKVFTFSVVINKVDMKGRPLTGALFELYYNNSKNANEPNWIPIGWNELNETGTEFTFKGLDSGSYKLVETKVPDGYNKADDIYFDIEAVYDTESDDPKITSMVIKQDGKVVSEGENAKFQISANLGTATGSVENTSGIQLPHTGEVGRAILLYGGMSAIVVSVVAVVVAGKKKGKKA